MQVVITAEQGAEAHRLHQEIQGELIAGERCWLAAGRAFARMKQSGLYLALGFEDFKQYCDSPDVKLSRSQVYRLMRSAARTERLARLGLRHPEVLAEAASAAGIDVGPGTVHVLAERTVLNIGIANADHVLGRALDATDPQETLEWLAVGGLREIDVVREVDRVRRGGASDGIHDYLLGVKARGMAMFAELPSLDPTECMLRLREIITMCQDADAWLLEQSIERSRDARAQGPAAAPVGCDR